MELYNTTLDAHDPSRTVRGSRLGKTIAVGLLATTIFAALAHGAVEAWSVALFEGSIGVLFLLCAVKAVTDGRLKLFLPTTALPLAAFLGIGLLQSLAFADRGGRNWSLSADVEATRTTVLTLACLVLAFVIAANLFERRDSMRSLVWFLVAYGLAVALFALIQHVTWNGRFYWVRPTTAEHSMPFGPFVNRNHFAGYMELLMPLPIALVVARAVKRDARLFLMLAAAIMGAAAIVSLSRGGMISIAAEIGFIAVLGFRKRRLRSAAGSPETSKPLVRRFPAALRPVLLTVFLFALIGGGIFWIGSEPVINRLLPAQAGEGSKSETFYSSRGWIWRDTVTMIRANPILGVGLGAYETAYPIYSRDDGSILLGQAFSVDRAHNDYLQILADCGVIGGALAICFIVLVFRAVARGLRSRDPLTNGMALGCGAAVFGILVHSFFDFNLQLPSHALLFLLLTAIVSRIAAGFGEDSLHERSSARRYAASYERGALV